MNITWQFMFIYKWELRIEFFPIFNSLRFYGCWHCSHIIVLQQVTDVICVSFISQIYK